MDSEEPLTFEWLAEIKGKNKDNDPVVKLGCYSTYSTYKNEKDALWYPCFKHRGRKLIMTKGDFLLACKFYQMEINV